MTLNKIVRSEKSSMKVSRSCEKIDNKTVRSEKQRLVSKPRKVRNGR